MEAAPALTLNDLKEAFPGVIPPEDKDPLANFRKAIKTLSLEEMNDLIETKIMEFNCLNKIELHKGQEVIILGDKPRHYLFPDILTAVNTNVPAALIGPAGSGKSTVVKEIAEALGLKFYLQNSVSGTHELSGYMDAYGKYHTTAFRQAYQLGGVIFVDEVDTSDPGALKWINTAMANGYAMFPDQPEPVYSHRDFRILIAANTYGSGADRMYVGANQLDASTLDRFVFFDFGYDEKLEKLIAGNPKWTDRVQRLRKAAMAEKARMVISPRASINGAKLLASGWKQDVVEQRVIWKGIDAELKARIEKKAA